MPVIMTILQPVQVDADKLGLKERSTDTNHMIKEPETQVARKELNLAL